MADPRPSPSHREARHGLQPRPARLESQERGSLTPRALFDSSREAVLARKYEATAEREFYRALDRIEQLNTGEEIDDPAYDVDATTSQAEESGNWVRFFRGDRPKGTARL